MGAVGSKRQRIRPQRERAATTFLPRDRVRARPGRPRCGKAQARPFRPASGRRRPPLNPPAPRARAGRSGGPRRTGTPPAAPLRLRRQRAEGVRRPARRAPSAGPPRRRRPPAPLPLPGRCGPRRRSRSWRSTAGRLRAKGPATRAFCPRRARCGSIRGDRCGYGSPRKKAPSRRPRIRARHRSRGCSPESSRPHTRGRAPRRSRVPTAGCRQPPRGPASRRHAEPSTARPRPSFPRRRCRLPRPKTRGSAPRANAPPRSPRQGPPRPTCCLHIPPRTPSRPEAGWVARPQTEALPRDPVPLRHASPRAAPSSPESQPASAPKAMLAAATPARCANFLREIMQTPSFSRLREAGGPACSALRHACSPYRRPAERATCPCAKLRAAPARCRAVSAGGALPRPTRRPRRPGARTSRRASPRRPPGFPPRRIRESGGTRNPTRRRPDRSSARRRG